MNGLKETVLAVCIIIVATEVICRLCPKNSMVGFVRALIITVLLASAVVSMTRMEFTFSLEDGIQTEAGEELTDYLDEEYENAAAAEMQGYVSGLMSTIDIETKKN